MTEFSNAGLGTVYHNVVSDTPNAIFAVLGNSTTFNATVFVTNRGTGQITSLNGSSGGESYAGYNFTGLAAGTYDITFTSTYPTTESGSWYHNPITIYSISKPVASLASPAAGSNVAGTTPTIVIGYTNAQTGSPHRFSAYDYKVIRSSDSHSLAGSNPENTSTAQQTAGQVSVVYGDRSTDTALTVTIPVKIAVRVMDYFYDTWSDWSAYVEFTPASIPNVPTDVLPTGVQSTLTPTVGLTYNAGPSALDLEGWKYEFKQGTTTIYQSGEIADSVADGGTVTQTYGTANGSDTPSTPPTFTWGPNLFVRAAAKNTDDVWGEWSEWTTWKTESIPLAPSMLAPDRATTSDTTPTLAFKHNSPDGVDLTHVQIWLQTDAGVAVTGYDPKIIALADLDSYDTITKIGKHTVTTAVVKSPATNYVWWSKTEADTGPGYSPASVHATFIASPGPTISISNIDAGDDWLTSTLQVVHDITAATGTTLASRMTKLYKADGTTLIESSGSVAISGTTDTGTYTFTARVNNNLDYYVQSSATDSNGDTVLTDLIPFTANFTPPDTITGLSVTMIGGDEPDDRSNKASLPGVLVVWATVADNVNFLRYTVWRQGPDDDDLVILGTVTNINNGSFVDYLCAGTVTYNYNLTQTVDDGTGADLESNKATSVSIAPTFGASAFLQDYGNPEYYAELPTTARKRKRTGMNTFVQVWDSPTPIAYTSNTKGRVMDLEFPLPWVTGYKDKAKALDDVQDRQIDEGSTLVYRDKFGEVIYCVIDGDLEQDDDNHNTADITLTIIEVAIPKE